MAWTRALTLCLGVALSTILSVGESGELSDLDDAFAQPTSFLVLELLGSKDFSVTKPVSVSNQAAIRGQSQTIRLSAAFSVALTGRLSISNVTFTSSPALRDQAFNVLGSCVFENVLFEEFDCPIFVISGSLGLWKTRFASNSEQSLQVMDGATVNCSHIEVIHSASSFLVTGRGSQAISILVTQSLFRYNGPSAALFQLSNEGEVHITASKFESNECPLLQVDSVEVVIVCDSCLYLNNSGSFLSGYLRNARITCLNSEFADNSLPLVTLLQFEGNFRMQNSTLLRHRTPLLISVAGHSAEVSIVVFQTFKISDTVVNVSQPLDAGIAFYSCLAEFSDFTLLNVMLSAQYYHDLTSLIYGSQSQIRLFNFSASRAGSSGLFISIEVGALMLDHFYFERIYSGAGGFVFAAVGSVEMYYGQVVEIVEYTKVSDTPGLDSTVLFAFQSSLVKMAHIHIFGPTPLHLSMLMAIGYTTLHLESVNASELSTNIAIVIIESSGTLNNLQLTDFVSTMNMLHISQSTFTISGCIVRNVRFAFPRYGIFHFSSKCNITMEDIRVIDIISESFLRVKESIAILRSVTVEKSSINMLLNYILHSHVELYNFIVSHSRTQILQLIDSNMTIVHSIFVDLEVVGTVIGGTKSNLSLRNVTFTNVTSDGFCKFRDGSTVRMNFSQFAVIYSSSGCEIRDSSLIVTACSFHSFDFTMFPVAFSNVTLISSRFEEGKSYSQSLLSDVAYGGAIGCVDCPSLEILDCRMTNVSALFGGAVSTRLIRNSGGRLSVTNSSFEGCSARIGGAVFVLHISFVISNSRFLTNSAEQGGGVYAALNSGQRGAVQHTLFLRNSATQGGGILSTAAEVLFTNVSFQANEAEYGPDVASFGVLLSSRLTLLSNQSVSGGHLTLIFELLDHYNQRVTVSKPKFLMLMSTSEVKYRGNVVAPINAGIFNFSELTIYASPASEQIIKASLVFTGEDSGPLINGSISIHFRECIAGEIKRADRCEVCYSGNYSFTPSDSNCRFCPPHSTCPGGSKLLVHEGYWQNNSAAIQKCPFKSACVGGEQSTCAEAWSGYLCADCSTQAYRFRALECTVCSSFVLLQLAGAAVSVIFFVAGVLLLTICSPFLFFAFKIMIHHLQMLSVLSYLRLAYSPILSNALHGIMYASSWLVPDLPLDCLGRFPVWGKAVLGSALLPVFGLLMLMLNQLSLLSQKNAAVVFTSSLLFIPPVTLQAILPLLVCWESNSDDRVLLFPGLQCWKGTHNLLVYALLLPTLLMCVLVPFLLALVWGCVRPHSFQNFFPLWTCGYTWPLWELFFSIAKAVLFTVTITTMYTSELVQVTALLTAIIVIACINVALSTVFVLQRQFAEAQASLLVIALSAGFLSYYLYSEPGEGKAEWLSVCAVLLLNSGMFALVLLLECFGNKQLSQHSEVRVCAPHSSFASAIMPENLEIR